MSVLGELRPKSVWTYFEEICKIPRLSKNEGKIRQYLTEFAKSNNLESSEDETGNILITRPADASLRNRKTVVLQSHMDMVGEKSADHPHNWASDPVIPLVRGSWVRASGTTLGADDGVGVATQLAILTDKNLKTGRIECLFTVDEESGMTGAINLKPGFFTGRTLINLDSEDEGILFIGCAGGIDTIGTIHYNPVRTPENSSALLISVTGLHGGHSGDEIHKGYGNSIKLMTGLFDDISEISEISLAYFDGGNLRNAIPREASAIIVFERSMMQEVKNRISKSAHVIKAKFGSIENELDISSAETALPSHVIDRLTKDKLMTALRECPHGVIDWSKEMENLVETSTNLASVKFETDNIIRIITTQRSSIESSKNKIAREVEECFVAAGADVVHSEGYPGWKPDLNSKILRMTKNSYIKLFGKEPLVRAIHAGLECGLIYEKFKGIDMISFGPTIRGAHTTEEMIEIETVQMFWDLLIDIITTMPSVD